MKLIITVVRPERLTAVKEALFRVGVTGMTLSRASGHGGEREIVEHYRGSSVVLEFREKVRIEMAVSDSFVQPTGCCFCDVPALLFLQQLLVSSSSFGQISCVNAIATGWFARCRPRVTWIVARRGSRWWKS